MNKLIVSMQPARAAWVLLALALVFGSTTPAVACPMCKVALTNHDTAEGDIVQGFMWSILFMLSMPFITIGGFTSYMYLLVRRARAKQNTLLTAAPERPLGQNDRVASTVELAEVQV